MINNQVPDSWDETINSLGGSFLQSVTWAKFQQTLEREIFLDQGDDWAYLAILQTAGPARYLYLPYGPVYHNYQAFLRSIESLNKLARDQKVDFVRIEPNTVLAESWSKEINAIKVDSVQPEHTWVLDLSPSVDELKSALESGHRNHINTASKRGIVISTSTKMDDVDDFLMMLHDTAQRSGYKDHPDQYYHQMCREIFQAQKGCFYIASVENQRISMSLMYDFNGVRYYSHSGALQELNRKLKTSVVLVWQAILDAKENGLNKFDFWGIAPNDDPNHKWAGLSAFKKGFGGQLVTYQGTWDIPINKLKYRSFQLVKKLRGRG